MSAGQKKKIPAWPNVMTISYCHFSDFQFSLQPIWKSFQFRTRMSKKYEEKVSQNEKNICKSAKEKEEKKRRRLSPNETDIYHSQKFIYLLNSGLVSALHGCTFKSGGRVAALRMRNILVWSTNMHPSFILTV